MEDISNYYNSYFKEFRDKAPKNMVEWGGYQNGEPTGMASSLESCLSFCKYINNQNISLLDAGAGASSWIFRKLFKNVTTTDPDRDYLEVVKSIVKGENYIHLITNCLEYDYVYWDYGNWQRIPTMENGFSKAKKAMYIDDCHDKEVLEHVKYLSGKYNSKIIETDSLDKYGRFGVILQK